MFLKDLGLAKLPFWTSLTHHFYFVLSHLRNRFWKTKGSTSSKVFQNIQHQKTKTENVPISDFRKSTLNRSLWKDKENKSQSPANSCFCLCNFRRVCREPYIKCHPSVSFPLTFVSALCPEEPPPVDRPPRRRARREGGGRLGPALRADG